MTICAKLMADVFESHVKFKRIFRDWLNGRLGSKFPRYEPEAVTLARKEFLARVDVLYDVLVPLEKAFLADPHASFGELCDFLATDILAFRAGYAKEIFLQRLKQVDLSADERSTLQKIALDYCRSDTVRREFRRWCRLMVKIADEPFVRSLAAFVGSQSGIQRAKARWMLRMIILNRADLLLPDDHLSTSNWV